MSGIVKLLSLDGIEITEHNRKYSGTESIASSDVELDSGINKRYIRKNKQTLSLSFTYIPSLAIHTVDARVGRNYLQTIANKRGKVAVIVQLDPEGSPLQFDAYVTSYSETLIKRDVANQCAYYDVTLALEEA
jgi:hypothetical protein